MRKGYGTKRAHRADDRVCTSLPSLDLVIRSCASGDRLDDMFIARTVSRYDGVVFRRMGDPMPRQSSSSGEGANRGRRRMATIAEALKDRE